MPPSGISDLPCRHGNQEQQAISSFSFLENISPVTPTKSDCNFPLVGMSEEVSSPVNETNQSQEKDQRNFNPGFETSGSHGNESGNHGNDLDFDRSPFDVIQSYCKIENEWDKDENKENTTDLDPLYSKLVQSQYSDDDLIVYYDETLPSSNEELLAKCNLDIMGDSLTESAVSQGGQYHIEKPEHPTVRYLKEESRRESLGRLSSSDEEFLDLSDICCEKFSSNSSNEELFL